MDNQPEHQNNKEELNINKDVEVIPGDYVGANEAESDTKGKKGKKMNIALYLLLSIGSFGLWNRFRPRKGGWKGSWFVTAAMLATLSGALITERFYKAEFNDLAREQLQLEVDVLPEVLPFEQGKLSTSEDLQLEIDTLKHQISGFESTIAELQSKLQNAETILAGKHDEAAELVANLSKEIDARDAKIKELEMQLDAEKSVAGLSRELAIADPTQPLRPSAAKLVQAADMKFSVSSITSAGDEVGCNTKFSDERSADVFAKDYRDHLIKWTGEVVDVNKDYVEIVSEGENPSKARIMFANKGDGYYMVKGESVTMQAKLIEKASCEVPFVAEQGTQKK